jgi:hypothetical protein
MFAFLFTFQFPHHEHSDNLFTAVSFCRLLLSSALEVERLFFCIFKEMQCPLKKMSYLCSGFKDNIL